jgi:hypothetical protein
MHRTSKFAIASGFVVALLASAPGGATEQPPQASAESLLGADVQGENWTVAPVVPSDGYLWIFAVKTPYGDFHVNGQHRMKERLQELRALGLLEKMSRTKAFGDAMISAGLAPIRFGRDLILDPFETVGNFVSGVAKMFDTVVASVGSSGGSRDPFFDSVTGITKAERELALELRVDPYSDFTPLRSGLEDVARATTAGSLPITAAISMIPGGAGIAVSSVSTASQASDVVYSHTSRETLEIVTNTLSGLGVDKTTTKKFVDNTFYSPADEFAIAEALAGLSATNSAAFIESAATAGSFDVAKFNRYRVELLMRESARLGTLKSFVLVSGIALNRDVSGRIVAAFPFDTLAWTDIVSRSLTRLSIQIAAQHETQPAAFASTGVLSRLAKAELKKLGWDTVELN